jgi:hypothetical protein
MLPIQYFGYWLRTIYKISIGRHTSCDRYGESYFKYLRLFTCLDLGVPASGQFAPPTHPGPGSSTVRVLSCNIFPFLETPGPETPVSYINLAEFSGVSPTGFCYVTNWHRVTLIDETCPSPHSAASKPKRNDRQHKSCGENKLLSHSKFYPQTEVHESPL